MLFFQVSGTVEAMPFLNPLSFTTPSHDMEAAFLPLRFQ
jgi:hypothetical protein